MLQLCIVVSCTYLRLWSRSQNILTCCMIQVTHIYHCCIDYNLNSMWNDTISQSSVVILYGTLCLWVRSQIGTNWKSSRRTHSGTRGDAVYSVHSHVFFLTTLLWTTSAFGARSGVERILSWRWCITKHSQGLNRWSIITVLLLIAGDCFSFRCEGCLFDYE